VEVAVPLRRQLQRRLGFADGGPGRARSVPQAALKARVGTTALRVIGATPPRVARSGRGSPRWSACGAELGDESRRAVADGVRVAVTGARLRDRSSGLGLVTFVESAAQTIPAPSEPKPSTSPAELAALATKPPPRTRLQMDPHPPGCGLDAYPTNPATSWLTERRAPLGWAPGAGAKYVTAVVGVLLAE
jgi:hypothetical protein